MSSPRPTLDGYGIKEVRLALASDGDVLLAGINGNLLGLDTDRLEIKWKNDFALRCSGFVSVFGGPDSHVSAVANGRVYSLDKSNGSILAEVALRGASSTKAYYQCSAAGTNLLIGFDGYAWCVTIKDLKPVWSREMPTPGPVPHTTVALGPYVTAYFGRSGCVFRLDASGRHLAEFGWPDPNRTDETSVFADPTHSVLLAGTMGKLHALQYAAAEP